MGAPKLNATVKSRLAATAVAVLIGILLPVAAHSANRRPLALTAFDFQTNLRGQRVVPIGRLKAALTEHLELMGETVRVLDTVPTARRCLTRECQLSLARESQSDILYVEIEQTSESTFSITLWLWKFDKDAGTPITEYPVSTKEICVNCDEVSLTQKLLEKVGSFVEQKIEPRAQVALKTPDARMMLQATGYEGSRWQRLSTKRKVGVAVLSTISTISLVSAVALTAIQGSGGTNFVLYDQYSSQRVAVTVNLIPFYGTAYCISLATGAGLLAILLW